MKKNVRLISIFIDVAGIRQWRATRRHYVGYGFRWHGHRKAGVRSKKTRKVLCTPLKLICHNPTIQISQLAILKVDSISPQFTGDAVVSEADHAWFWFNWLDIYVIRKYL